MATFQVFRLQGESSVYVDYLGLYVIITDPESIFMRLQ